MNNISSQNLEIQQNLTNLEREIHNLESEHHRQKEFENLLQRFPNRLLPSSVPHNTISPTVLLWLYTNGHERTVYPVYRRIS
jgi:hypothetical protein